MSEQGTPEEAEARREKTRVGKVLAKIGPRESSDPGRE